MDEVIHKNLLKYKKFVYNKNRKIRKVSERIMSNDIRLILSELQNYLKIHYENRMKHILLYGSQARGDALEGSDIDILIILDGQVDPGDEIEKTGDIITDVSLKYNVVISCVFISEEEFKYRNGPFLRNIRKEGIPV